MKDTETPQAVGQPVSRLEGRLKVTGAARYAGEYNVPDLLYGYVVNSTLTKGKIKSMHTEAALAVEGVVAVLTHENRPSLPAFDLKYADLDAPPGLVFRPLYDAFIKFNGQPIALVVARSFEAARYAATLVEVVYDQEDFETCLSDHLAKGRDAKKGMATALKPPPPSPTGNFEAAYAAAPVKVETAFSHGAEHHNPMELFATTTVYEGERRLTIYDKTQGTVNNQVFVANVFGLPFKNVRVIAPFVGGAFGAGLRPQYQLFLCVMAALHLKRNVRVTLDRSQMFTFGHRPQSLQHLRFSTDADGRLNALNHVAFSETSQFEDYTEAISNWSHKLYPAENTLFKHKLVPLDLCTPLDMRAPGGCTGMHAIECTMDELAYKLGLDPLELRLRNYSETDPSSGKPFTSKALRECYTEAAQSFGWDKRNPQPGSMTRGNRLVGYGMATGIWDAYQFPSRVEVIITPEGKLFVNNAVTDIGTGTLTVMTQIAADEMGLPLEDVIFSYGDGKKPFSMFQGGSATVASTGAGIVAATQALKRRLLRKVREMGHPAFNRADVDEVVFRNGSLYLRASPGESVAFTDIVAANNGQPIRAISTGGPRVLKLRKHSKATHSATFVEVEIDRELKTITVTRAVTAVAAGRIINPKTAGSQVTGSMIWGISKALYEESILDKNFGKFINANLGEYHIPVHADVPEMTVIFANEPDALINELGVKGVGEVGMVGVPAAVANAVFHATGKRLYKLPIHFDDLL